MAHSTRRSSWAGPHPNWHPKVFLGRAPTHALSPPAPNYFFAAFFTSTNKKHVYRMCDLIFGMHCRKWCEKLRNATSLVHDFDIDAKVTFQSFFSSFFRRFFWFFGFLKLSMSHVGIWSSRSPFQLGACWNSAHEQRTCQGKGPPEGWQKNPKMTKNGNKKCQILLLRKALYPGTLSPRDAIISGNLDLNEI